MTETEEERLKREQKEQEDAEKKAEKDQEKARTAEFKKEQRKGTQAVGFLWLTL